MTVKAAMYCLVHVFIIPMARVNGDRKYKSYRNVRAMKKPVEDLLKTSGGNLCNAGGFKELQQFQEYLSDYKIIVYDGLTLIGLCLVKILFRVRNCTSYMMRKISITM